MLVSARRDLRNGAFSNPRKTRVMILVIVIWVSKIKQIATPVVLLVATELAGITEGHYQIQILSPELRVGVSHFPPANRPDTFALGDSLARGCEMTVSSNRKSHRFPGLSSRPMPGPLGNRKAKSPASLPTRTSKAGTSHRVAQATAAVQPKFFPGTVGPRLMSNYSAVCSGSFLPLTRPAL